MALFRRKTAVVDMPERRMAKRRSVDCPARLKMLGGDKHGRLTDLSEAGARFDTTDPPCEGVSGLLEWNNHEYFGKIVWANEHGCGVVFERPIPHSVVDKTVGAAAADPPQGPVANFGKIPMGQKRGRRTVFVPE
ncbi:PilZ domain-containing protein [Erythrobacter litoralis]|uniref:PilZ domain-containing protein n=1 Tax=Erythrobacter litoralis TaxID=39960 RepID=UPI002434C291|nr:PilZ domain-containing protein [Erythrobacter litoralis]MDG6079662.1 PilZ domain-containing protein [Erythrobacter litoralis]